MLWAVWKALPFICTGKELVNMVFTPALPSSRWSQCSSLAPFYQEPFIPPLSQANVLRAAQKPVTPHTLLRPSVPLCRLFHFIDSRVTFIVVSAK